MKAKHCLLAIIALAAIALAIMLWPKTQAPSGGQDATQVSTTTSLPVIRTFIDNGGAVETKNGKPVIRMYSTTSCPHCKWVKGAYEEVANEYVNKSLIIAYHWELDIDLDVMRQEAVDVPKSEKDIFIKFNPRRTVPTFVFASKYYRIGNGYESKGDLEAEKAEFRAVIERLIEESRGNIPLNGS
ncbi:MAG: thioredoxin family protein [Candidatus Altiarchaeota archaeon]|nr:thioredoxin family protein [Candidatus Altiarchaeota archaeon]